MATHNIYEGCLSNQRVICHEFGKDWDEQLSEARRSYQEKGLTVLFVDISSGALSQARVVLYRNPKDIPLSMRHWSQQWVHFSGHWVQRVTLGVCDKCGEYKPLMTICKDGHLCEACDDDEI